METVQTTEGRERDKPLMQCMSGRDARPCPRAADQVHFPVTSELCQEAGPSLLDARDARHVRPGSTRSCQGPLGLRCCLLLGAEVPRVWPGCPVLLATPPAPTARPQEATSQRQRSSSWKTAVEAKPASLWLRTETQRGALQGGEARAGSQDAQQSHRRGVKVVTYQLTPLYQQSRTRAPGLRREEGETDEAVSRSSTPR